MKIITAPAKLHGEPQIESIAPKGDMLLFDIETTGLSKVKTQTYLIGCAFYENDSWMIRQYLAESALDEREILESFFQFASGYQYLVHFNGEGFDIPYLDFKQEFYGLGFDFTRFHSVDIYKYAKPLRKLLDRKSLSQKSIEEFLHIDREDQLNGGLLIPYYYEFERTGDPKAEELLLLHNFEDVQGMLEIPAILKYLSILDGAFTFDHLETSSGYAILTFQLNDEMPVPFERSDEKQDVIVCAEGHMLQISIRMFEGTARFPLEDVENYFYLPAEDKVIHKDVAQFVDRQYRKKATKKNCFLKKEGSFLPQNHPYFQPAYMVEGDKKRSYFELSQIADAEQELLTEYALDIINS